MEKKTNQTKPRRNDDGGGHFFLNWTIHYRGVSWRYSIQFAIDQRVDTGSPGRTERATEAAGAGGAVGGAGAATPQGKPGGGRGGGGGGEATRRRSSLDQLLFVSIFFILFFSFRHFLFICSRGRVCRRLDLVASSITNELIISLDSSLQQQIFFGSTRGDSLRR